MIYAAISCNKATEEMMAQPEKFNAEDIEWPPRRRNPILWVALALLAVVIVALLLTGCKDPEARFYNFDCPLECKKGYTPPR